VTAASGFLSRRVRRTVLPCHLRREGTASGAALAATGEGYDTPRWEDAGPLIPGGRKGFIRKATERETGRECVLKHASGNRRRFYDEAVNMQRLNGTPGILPVLDVDDTQSDRPALYAMPRHGSWATDSGTTPRCGTWSG
jgi:hypothetical protein